VGKCRPINGESKTSGVGERMTTTKKKACVILGAGASYDVANDGAPIRNPELRPPLARELFNMEKRREFSNVMTSYPGAKVLSSSLAPLVE